MFGAFASQLADEIRLRGGSAPLQKGQSSRFYTVAKRETLSEGHSHALSPALSPALSSSSAAQADVTSIAIDMGNPLLAGGLAQRAGKGRGARSRPASGLMGDGEEADGDEGGE